MTRMKPLVVRSALVASIGGLIFGFDTAVISGTTEQLKSYFHLDDAYLGWTVGVALLGTILGALTAGPALVAGAVLCVLLARRWRRHSCARWTPASWPR